MGTKFGIAFLVDQYMVNYTLFCRVVQQIWIHNYSGLPTETS
jgi:hypothetical protein